MKVHVSDANRETVEKALQQSLQVSSSEVGHELNPDVVKELTPQLAERLIQQLQSDSDGSLREAIETITGVRAVLPASHDPRNAPLGPAYDHSAMPGEPGSFGHGVSQK